MKSEKPLIIVLLGAPGSGKGTLADFISNEYGYAHICTGDLFRKEIQEQGPLAQKLSDYLNKGLLVPDSLVLTTVLSLLSSPSFPEKYILDGFPRTLPQAEALHYFLNEQHKTYLVINLVISQETVIKRLSSRLNCNICKKIFRKQNDLHEGSLCPSCDQGILFLRDDDTAPIIAKRLEIYQKQTQPIEAFYTQKDILKNVVAEDTPQDIFDKIKPLLSVSEIV